MRDAREGPAGGEPRTGLTVGRGSGEHGGAGGGKRGNKGQTPSLHIEVGALPTMREARNEGDFLLECTVRGEESEGG